MTSFSRTQIALHWLVALAVVFEVVAHDAMHHYEHAIADGTPVSSRTWWGVQLHIWVGVAVLAAALWRMVLRMTRGVPDLPEQESAVLRLIAHLTHVALYVAILMIPLTGILSWFWGVEWAAKLHRRVEAPLIALVGLHVAGALWQHFVIRSDVLRRMLRWR